MLNAYWEELAHSPMGCSVDQGILAWLYAKNTANIILDYDMSFVANKYHENFEFNDETGMYSILGHFNTTTYPVLIHHSGDKSKYYEYAEKVTRKYIFLN